MTIRIPIAREPETDQPDRRLIRVDCPLAQAGIAAALRRAFQTPARDVSCEEPFEALLSRLN